MKMKLYRFLLFHVHPLLLHLSYLLFFSTNGFLLLKLLPMRDHSKRRPTDLDLFFMAVSANTVASMDTVEMEEFSNFQLATLTLLMLVGGEVFLSMLTLRFSEARTSHILSGTAPGELVRSDSVDDLRIKSTSRFFHVVLGYLLVAHLAGYGLIIAYVSLVSDAGDVLRGRGLDASMFAIFTTVSSFANCGFLPTSDSMVAFRACSGLLLLAAAQVLAGNAMYPTCLWLVVWTLKRVTGRQEFGHMLRYGRVAGYEHLLPGPRAVSVGIFASGIVLLQVVVFCSMEWKSAGLTGLSSFQKIVCAAFQSVNSRYSGESVVDLEATSPAVLVLFVAMMYLPPYAYFWHGNNKWDLDKEMREEDPRKKRNKGLCLNLLSPVVYIPVFTIIVCITERRHMEEDPLNFAVLNILVEVVSAYGTAGFTTGYSCKRQVKLDTQCKDSSAGFSARWSRKGKAVLIVVMLFGRLKKFSTEGGE